MEYGRVVDTKAGHDDASKCMSLVEIISEKFTTKIVIERVKVWRSGCPQATTGKKQPPKKAVTMHREKSGGENM